MNFTTKECDALDDALFRLDGIRASLVRRDAIIPACKLDEIMASLVDLARGREIAKVAK